MTDSEFEALTDRTLTAIEAAFEASAPDALLDLHGGVLEVEFDNGTKIVVNRHSAAGEIWVAAKSGGYHFRYDGAVWRDTRDGSELFAALSRIASAQSGIPMVLGRAPG
jgi:CyaY protein